VYFRHQNQYVIFTYLLLLYWIFEIIFTGVEEDEVDTLDYPIDSMINLFSPIDYSLHQIFANTILHQDIVATFCVRDFSN